MSGKPNGCRLRLLPRVGKMKKLLTVYLLACALSETVNAATLISESFEGTFPPVGWTQNSVDPSTTYARTGTYSAKLGAAGDYLITPPLTHAQTLTYWTYTTSSDPDIIVETSSSASGPWEEAAESPFSGDTAQWNKRTIHLSSSGTLFAKIRKSGSGSLYIDDVLAEDGTIPSNQPPVLDPIGDKDVFEDDSLTFSVTADDPVDGDPVTLSATNLPTGAVFTNDTFTWNHAVPVGAYSVTFIATDKDGSDSETITITVFERPELLISEIADPAGTGADVFRFVELYNAGTIPIDLSADRWYLSRQNNGSTWYDVLLTGTVSGAETYVIAKSRDDFFDGYGRYPDQEDSNVDGNGNDAYFLYRGGDHNSGLLIDIYGELDTDGAGTDWEYTDSQAERNETILNPNMTWTASEWAITPGATTNDMIPSQHGPRPVFEPLEDLFVFLGDDLSLPVTAVNTVRTDIITLSADALPDGAVFPTETGIDTVTSTLTWTSPTAGIHTVTFTAAGRAGDRNESVQITVSSTSQIDTYFYGWKSGTIVKLKNKQFWRNTGGVGSTSFDPPLYKPDITITNLFGQHRMFVENVPVYTTVEPIDITESGLDNPFSGLHNGNLYELEDGTTWEQISFDNISTTANPVTVWRWEEDGKTWMRFLNRHDGVIGTCEVIASGGSVNPPIISRIDGWFRGWKNKRIFILQNGQFWQQIVAKDSSDTLRDPVATVTNYQGTGTWRLYVEDAGPPAYVEVRQLNNVTRTAIDGTFYGFGLRNIYPMQDGGWWRQTSQDSSASTRSNPEIFIWNESGTTVLEMPDEGRAVEAEELNVLLESAVTNEFTGLHYANIYKLASGQDWMQVSFENIRSNTSAPAAMLWAESGSTNLLARDSNDKTIGTCTVVNPWADSDGDQIPNASELIAGTSLYDRNDFFLITDIQYDSQGRAILHWASIAGRIYRIQWTPALNETFQTLEDSIVWPQNSWTNTVHTVEPKGFYRITVRLAN